MGKPGLLKRLQAAYKVFNAGDWLSSGTPGNVYTNGRTGYLHWVPGTNFNWDRLAGDLWMCPAVQSCLNWIYRNFPQAPPIVEQKDRKGEWSSVAGHPLIELLNKPNPRYDGTLLFQGWILSILTNGNAYAVIERTKAGEPAELWYVPHHLVTPYTQPGNDPRFVDYYDYWLGPKHIQVPPEDMLHLRYGIDPIDQRLGLSPLASAARDVNGLQQAGNYRANILRNAGIPGVVISQDPNSKADIDPTYIRDQWNARTQFDGVGSTLVTDASINATFPKASPQDMALTTLEDRPEADICALIGVPIQVTGLYGGREAKTYQNMREAREAAWEECLIPLGAMFSGQIGGRLLPEFMGTTRSNANAVQAALADIRMTFDYRDIRPLQPDLDALHARALKDWLANLLTLAEWCQIVGRPDPPAEVANMRYTELGGQPQQINERLAQQNQLGDSATPEPKSARLEFPLWSERIEKELAAIEARHVPSANGNGVH